MVHDIPNTQPILSSLKDTWWVYQRICQEYCIACYSKHTPYFFNLKDSWWVFQMKRQCPGPKSNFWSSLQYHHHCKWWRWIVSTFATLFARFFLTTTYLPTVPECPGQSQIYCSCPLSEVQFSSTFNSSTVAMLSSPNHTSSSSVISPTYNNYYTQHLMMLFWSYISHYTIILYIRC